LLKQAKGSGASAERSWAKEIMKCWGRPFNCILPVLFVFFGLLDRLLCSSLAVVFQDILSWYVAVTSLTPVGKATSQFEADS
jgi:hypothetical protein